jgi:ATP-binding cassette subfamily B protein
MADEQRDDEAPVTVYDLYGPSAERVDVRRLPELAASSLRLLWAAARGEFLLVAVLQLIGGLGLVAPILAGRDLLAAVLAADGIGRLPQLLWQAALVLGVYAALRLTTTLAAARNHVLSELVVRHTQQRILDVTCVVELEAFDTPAFHNRLERASMSAHHRPIQLVHGLISLGSAVVGASGVALALAALEPLLLPLTVLAGIPLWLASVRSGQLMFKMFSGLTPADRERAYLLSLLTGRHHAKEVRAYRLAAFLRARWERRTAERIHEVRQLASRKLRIELLAAVGSGIVLGLVLAGLLGLVLSGLMSVPDAAAAGGAVLLLGSQLRTAAIGTDLLFEAAPFVKDFTDFLADQRREPADGRPAPKRFEHLAVEDLRFTYPSGDRPALDGALLEIRGARTRVRPSRDLVRTVSKKL